MRVERARSEGSDTNKSETRAKNIQFQTAVTASTTKTAEGTNQGAFSKVLDVARQTSENGRTEKQAVDGEKDLSVDGRDEGKKESAVEAKGTRRDDQKNFSGENDGEGESAWVPAPVLA